jgi:hypothetical protein
MMWENSVIGKLWSFIKAYKQSIFIIFEAFWLLFLWVVSPFVPDVLALIIPPAAAFATTLLVVLCISPVLTILKKKDWYDHNMAGLVLYGTGYLLTLYLTIELLQKVVEAFHISKVEHLEFSLQATAFLLYIVFFCAFRNPKQTQYWAYALAYGFFILWEWFVDQNVADCALLNIDAEFTLNYFIIPFKEAMLLFIILDTFLKAKEELNQEKRLRNEEKKIC